MKQKLLLFVLLAASQISAQQQFSKWITYLNIAPSSVRDASIDSFMTANSGQLPYIENDTAVFIYRGTANTMQIAGDFNGWSPGYTMTRVSSSTLYYYKKAFENNARLDYKYVRNGSSWILDPHNPRTVTGGFGPNSELAMPGYIQPPEIIYNSAIPHGTVLTTQLIASNGAGTFQIKIYLPPGYGDNPQKRYPAAYFHDGFEYIDLASAVHVMDNLTAAGKIEPLVGVFVRPNNRNDEYAGSKRSQYAEFFAQQLVPYIDAQYRTQAQANKRMTAGDSFGGNISGYISYHYPEVFGLCGLHSGAFWPNSYEVYNLFINAPFKPVKFAAVWGTYESLFTNMRNFRDQMTAKGNELIWSELPEGHSWGLWRANIDFLLEYFFPPVPSSAEEDITAPGLFTLSAYPNPFNPETTVGITLGQKSFVTLSVYNLAGEQVKVLFRGEAEAGTTNIRFNAENLPAGTYFAALRTQNSTKTLKIMLLK
ncbi:MAG: T9SS type A sorting domain-containing protein [Ignavibacteriaceae bacterium]|nr:T9SS type A sorting domain-containing protein [Ignavibacteriaceae bacterium]